jgi:hypothetical protein
VRQRDAGAIPEQKQSRKKNPGLTPGKRYAIERIGAFGQSNRVSGNGTTLLLTVTPAKREPCRRKSTASLDA